MTTDRIGLLGENLSERSKLDRASLATMLYEALKDVTLEEFAHMFTSEAQSALEYFELQRGGKTCKLMSLLYNPHRLDTGTKFEVTKDYKTVYEALASPRFSDGLSRWMLSGRRGKFDLWVAIEVGVQGVQYANEFPPHVARDFCLRYGLSRKSRVIDPCAGWAAV